MIWLTWRQHRLQLLYGAVVLAILTVFLLSTGFGISAAFRSSGLAQCLSVPGRDCGAANDLFMGGGARYSGLWFTIPLFLIVPAMVGVFWGAPLVAREVEQGTHRLAWTQGVGRIRWAGTKVAALAAAALVGTASLAWILSWWSRPFVAASDNRFPPGVFDLRGIVPIAYALFALATGVAAGTLIRRTVPAKAGTGRVKQPADPFDFGQGEAFHLPQRIVQAQFVAHPPLQSCRADREPGIAGNP